jgi:hypothetical protein
MTGVHIIHLSGMTEPYRIFSEMLAARKGAAIRAPLCGDPGGD